MREYVSYEEEHGEEEENTRKHKQTHEFITKQMQKAGERSLGEIERGVRFNEMRLKFIIL